MNEPMAFWLSKSFYAVSDIDNAIKVLEHFKESDRVSKFLKQISVSSKKSIMKVTKTNNVSMVFLSFSYNPNDKELIGGFIDLLRTSNIEVVTGEKNPIGSLSKSIISKIKESVVFIVVMTKRDLKQNGKYTTSSWLLEEKGAAIALDKPCLMLVEDDIDNSEIGGIQGDAQRLHFTRNNFTSKVAESIRMIKDFGAQQI